LVISPSRHLLFMPSCFFPYFAFFPHGVLSSLPRFPFLLYSCAVVPQGDPEHNAWDARSLLSRLSVPNFSLGSNKGVLLRALGYVITPLPAIIIIIIKTRKWEREDNSLYREGENPKEAREHERRISQAYLVTRDLHTHGRHSL